MTDPMERMIADALTLAKIDFVLEQNGLDFYLPEHGLYIEVKQFHSERIAEQMSRAGNVIAAQGREAVKFLAELLIARRPPAAPVATGPTDAAVVPHLPSVSQ